MHIMEDLTEFVGTDKNKYYYVKPVKNHMMVWQELRDSRGEFKCGKLDLSVVNERILTEAGIWDDLPAKIKKEIIGVHEETKAERKERMAHARKQRKKKYEGLPKELVCKCGKKVTANWSILNKKADKLGIPAVELAEKYLCQSCNPTKGRKKKK